MSHTNEVPQKTRIAMVCPCCSGEVTRHRYSFDVLVAAPFRWTKWYVCDQCEAALTGTDNAARLAVERAFEAYFEDSGQ